MSKSTLVVAIPPPPRSCRDRGHASTRASEGQTCSMGIAPMLICCGFAAAAILPSRDKNPKATRTPTAQEDRWLRLTRPRQRPGEWREGIAEFDCLRNHRALRYLGTCSTSAGAGSRGGGLRLLSNLLPPWRQSFSVLSGQFRAPKET